jgi:hypothetical protein
MEPNADIEIIETSERKVRSIFMGTCFTILVLLLSVSYGMVWGVLFLVWTSKETYPPQCDELVSWDKALYIVQFISSGLHLVSSIFQLIATSYDRESNIPKYIMGCRSCLVYIAGICILIGINASYFSNPKIDDCRDLKGLNLAYIITEWTILGTCITFVCVVCNVSLLLKKRKNKQKNKNRQ